MTYLLLLALFFLQIVPFSFAGQSSFKTGAWIPYWNKTEGCRRVIDRIDHFTALSPFSFEVLSDGTIKNTLKIEEQPWIDLMRLAALKGVAVIPSVLWTDAKAMHEVLSDGLSRKQHVLNILKLLKAKKFDGIDIDYEGKSVDDRDFFSLFITELSTALKENGYCLSCTVEARSQDLPKPGWTGSRAMSWANDLAVLNAACDEVRVMAYDQSFQSEGAKEWTDSSEPLYAPNSDIRWVEKVVKYVLGRVSAEKVILGIPTYGWEYEVKGASGKWSYKKVRSLSYPEAMRIADEHGLTPKRDETGELSFVYSKDGGKYLAWFSDGYSVRQKIQLAERYGLGGVFFFKMDGLEDEKMWNELGQRPGKT